MHEHSKSGLESFWKVLLNVTIIAKGFQLQVVLLKGRASAFFSSAPCLAWCLLLIDAVREKPELDSN